MDYTSQLDALLDLGYTVEALLLTLATIGLFFVGLRTAEVFV